MDLFSSKVCVQHWEKPESACKDVTLYLQNSAHRFFLLHFILCEPLQVGRRSQRWTHLDLCEKVWYVLLIFHFSFKWAYHWLWFSKTPESNPKTSWRPRKTSQGKGFLGLHRRLLWLCGVFFFWNILKKVSASPSRKFTHPALSTQDSHWLIFSPPGSHSITQSGAIRWAGRISYYSRHVSEPKGHPSCSTMWARS